MAAPARTVAPSVAVSSPARAAILPKSGVAFSPWFYGLCAAALTLAVGGLVVVSMVVGRAEQRRLDALAPIWSRKSDSEWAVEAGSLAGDIVKSRAYQERGKSRVIEVDVSPFLDEQTKDVRVYLKLHEAGFLGEQVGFGRMKLRMDPEPDGDRPYSWRILDESVHIDPTPYGWRQ
ncbi:MAG TPA: hypothetical protein PLL78_09315 [Fimbriimonadaceae bacterium]|nr:hypothetical protein [Fimbriimonadaceae bacterium]